MGFDCDTGVTMGGQLRKKPNAFNLVHQLEFLQRTGLSADLTVKTLEAWVWTSGLCGQGCVHVVHVSIGKTL